MCGRFTYRLTWPEIVRLYRLPLDTPARNTQPRYNVCPTDPIDVAVERDGTRDCVSMRWGLVPYLVVEAAQAIEARDLQRPRRDRRRETVLPRAVQAPALPDPGVRLLRVARHAQAASSPTTSPAATASRLRSPGCGTGAATKRPAARRSRHATMMITEPNDFVRELHDRMPVILEPDQFEPWLSGEAGVEALKPAANDVLRRWPVSKRVNSSKAPADDPTLLEEVELHD